MTRATLDAMWSAVTARKRVLLKYLAKKAELLGLDRLAWYDLQAPLPQAGQVGGERLSYDEACGHVLTTFNGFSRDFGSFAESALGQQWVEVENRPGKRQGGFCTSFPTARAVADLHDLHRLGRQHVDLGSRAGARLSLARFARSALVSCRTIP